MTSLYPVYLGTVIREEEADTRVFFVSRRLVKRERWLVKSKRYKPDIYRCVFVFYESRDIFQGSTKEIRF